MKRSYNRALHCRVTKYNMLVSKTIKTSIWQKVIFLRTHWEFYMAQMTRRGQLTTAGVSKDGNSFICHQGDILPHLHFPYSNIEEVKTLLLRILNR